MKDFFEEAAEFAGRACGIIARDLSDISKPLGTAFRQGWNQAWEDNTAKTGDAAPASETP